MSNLIAILRREQAHFLKILNSLEREARIAAKGDAPDYRYIRCILDYFRGTPRRAHYRHIETLSRILESRAPELAAQITVNLRYHRTFDDRLDDLERCFLLFESGIPDGRAAFITATIRFAEFEKAHLINEDEHLLPAAEHILTAEELNLNVEACTTGPITEVCGPWPPPASATAA